MSSPDVGRNAVSSGRTARRAMVALTAILALWLAVPALASARVGWRLNGIPLKESIATQWKGNLKVEDSKTIGGPIAVECSDTIEGSAGVTGSGEVTKVATTSCAGYESCKKTGESISLTPVNLPWHSELAEVGGVLEDLMVNGGKGTPGFNLECKVIGIRIVDECKGTLGATLTNGESGVTAPFNKAAALGCSAGEAGSGFAEGSQSITASAGGKLSTEKEEPPTWLANGVPLEAAKAIGWKGTLTLTDTGGFYKKLSVKCEDSGSGLAGARYAGTMSTWSISKCALVGGSECESEPSIEILHLAWSTSLFNYEGAVRDLITPSEKGTTFKLKCKVTTGEHVTDECVGIPTTAMTNSGNTVIAAFQKEKFSCSLSPGAGGEVEGSQTIGLVSGEQLHVS